MILIHSADSTDILEAASRAARVRVVVITLDSTMLDASATQLVTVGAAIQNIERLVDDFADSVRLFRDDVKALPERPEPRKVTTPYRAPIAPIAGGRIRCAVLARGKLKRWRSLKEKRQAWGFA